eukprot:GHVQ01043604.1.p1 GENE.GHVQ01043604.1~~GHVQ01043604.1.p1  ORF type:complete len:516 (+),score=37.70 GHVQ01043604.1:213-1760(+)
MRFPNGTSTATAVAPILPPQSTSSVSLYHFPVQEQFQHIQGEPQEETNLGSRNQPNQSPLFLYHANSSVPLVATEHHDERMPPKQSTDHRCISRATASSLKAFSEPLSHIECTSATDDEPTNREHCINASVEKAASGMMDKPEHYPLSHVTSAIMMYCFVSISIVYLNWWVFTVSFKYPVVVSWIQQCVGLCVYYLLSIIGHFGGVEPLKVFPLRRPELVTAFKVLPLTLSFVCMVGSANVCLKYAQVSTYQVARSLTLIMTAFLSRVVLHQFLSFKTILACCVVVVGFFVGALDPSTLTFLGVLFGITSSFFQGLYNVMIKRSLVHVQGNTNMMLLYNLSMALILFIPIILLADETRAFYHLPTEPSVWLGIAGSGCLATLLNLVSFQCVKVTSPLSFNVVGMGKACVQSAGGIIFLGDRVSINSLMGILLTLIGSGWYSQVKLEERLRYTSAPADVPKAPESSRNQKMEDLEQHSDSDCEVDPLVANSDKTSSSAVGSASFLAVDPTTKRLGG